MIKTRVLQLRCVRAQDNEVVVVWQRRLAKRFALVLLRSIVH